MAQGFRSTKPAYLDPLQSQPVRDNFNAVATCNSGATAPANPDQGWLWMDTSDPLNYRLRMYISGVWVVILNNIAAGPPTQSGVGKYTHNQPVAAAAWTIVHSLNTDEITVTFWDDTANTLMLPDTVTIDSDDQITATFIGAVSGWCVVTG